MTIMEITGIILLRRTPSKWGRFVPYNGKYTKMIIRILSGEIFFGRRSTSKGGRFCLEFCWGVVLLRISTTRRKYG